MPTPPASLFQGSCRQWIAQAQLRYHVASRHPKVLTSSARFDACIAPPPQQRLGVWDMYGPRSMGYRAVACLCSLQSAICTQWVKLTGGQGPHVSPIHPAFLVIVIVVGSGGGGLRNGLASNSDAAENRAPAREAGSAGRRSCSTDRTPTKRRWVACERVS
jgi:hypothetical protein